MNDKSSRAKRVRFPIMAQFFAAFGCLGLLTVLVLFFVNSFLAEHAMIEQTQHNMLTILSVTDEQIAWQMQNLGDQILAIMVSKEFNEIALKIKQNEAPTMILRDLRSMYSVYLNRYLDIVNSSRVLYRDRGYNVAFGFPFSEALTTCTEAQRKAVAEGKGSVVWFLSPGETDKQPSILLARLMNVTDLSSLTRMFLPEEEKPILLLSLRADTFSQPILQNVGIESARYTLLDENGRLPTQQQDAAPSEWEPIAKALKAGKTSGFFKQNDQMYFYVQSKINGWVHVVHMPANAFSRDLIRDLRNSFLIAGMLLLGVLMFISMLFSHMFTRPISVLVKGARQLEAGEFGHCIQYRSHNELGYLVHRFNRMSLSIQRLIQENYQAQIRQRDMEILSLTTQFNPHFLYNTLNIIHWEVRHGDSKKAADMIKSLSSMMRYTTDQKQELTLLGDDIAWMHQYLDLMNARYGELFHVEWAVEESHFQTLVPKLFLQPLVENSILHGFRNIETGGVLRIEISHEGTELLFAVSDNGCGMDPDYAASLLQAPVDHHIALYNVHHRIQLHYGEAYGLRIKTSPGCGTKVYGRIPDRQNSSSQAKEDIPNK